MSIKKQVLKNKNVAKITFNLNKEEVGTAEKIAVLGDFNNWNPESNQMEKLKNGNFKTLIELETGKEYQFRYLIDNQNWLNDTEADKLVENNITSDSNAVLIL